MPKGRDKQGREQKKKPKAKLDKAAPAVTFQHHSVTVNKPAPGSSGNEQA